MQAARGAWSYLTQINGEGARINLCHICTLLEIMFGWVERKEFHNSSCQTTHFSFSIKKKLVIREQQALSMNKTLVSFKLYGNEIGSNGAASVAPLISTNKALMSIDLSSTPHKHCAVTCTSLVGLDLGELGLGSNGTTSSVHNSSFQLLTTSTTTGSVPP
ncbi:hypothetical protein Pelo_1632 [Pelomyxa schiedti]|nr:hypothetical protein Pelo_1632 [Pelomyxa schiedti]